MPTTEIRGAHINYEIVGDTGPWIALSPGGHRGMAELRSLAQRLADAGNRVLLHDRRNCGASDVVVDDTQPEYQIWADDLHALLQQLGVDSAWIGGSSSGCRLSLTYALRHPETVRGLLLWRVTGGDWATRRLAEMYYGTFAKIAAEGGMEAICATEHFSGLISERPENRDKLMAMNADWFVAAMEAWRDGFLAELGNPVLGFTAEQLKSVTVPAIVIPGNDNTHNRESGELAESLLPNSELYVLYADHEDVDLVPPADWLPKEGEMADAFLDFMRAHDPEVH